ncbi:MAG TPA: adenine phosphoribosyltransferase [Polyangiaceae bacterium]|nr:adenine phosphoribosyltransferase [Polyangiaceae bacterium]
MAARKRSTHATTKHVPPRPGPTPRGVEREAGDLGLRHRRGVVGSAVAFELEPLAYLRALVRDVPDFPRPGIRFKDITPLVGDVRGLQIAIDALAERLLGHGLDAVVAIESRGFIFGGALAARLNARFVPVRKAGKLPYLTDRISYALEYGSAELEVHRDALRAGMHVVVVDDLLATGGTAEAAAALAVRQGASVVAHAFVIELGFLGGRARLAPTPVVSLLRYD